MKNWVGGIRRSFTSTPNQINPVFPMTPVQVPWKVWLMMHSLTAMSSMDRWTQSLATSCIITDDYKRYTFTIRKGIYWQTPPTASQDNQYAWLNDDFELTSVISPFILKWQCMTKYWPLI